MNDLSIATHIENSTLYLGDCLEVLPTLDAESVDAVVCDPPYGLEFMKKDWDRSIPGVAFWREAIRVVKPGAHLLAFGGTRTHHRLMCAIEDAGWELRDCVMWVHGSGFPKSLDVSKAIDRSAGKERRIIGPKIHGDGKPTHYVSDEAMKASAGKSQSGRTTHPPETEPATEEARQWSGWGTALKPAVEIIVMARKPLVGTVAQNVLKYGTGALNVDGCRIACEGGSPAAIRRLHGGTPNTEKAKESEARGKLKDRRRPGVKTAPHPSDLIGRWPSNLIHDGSDEVLAVFAKAGERPTSSPDQIGQGRNVNYTKGIYGAKASKITTAYGDLGGADRFFYCAKATQEDRNAGLYGMEERQQDEMRKEGNLGGDNPRSRGLKARANFHATVKPLALMQYLCRLVTPPGGVILDPFMGSGSTGKAALLEGFGFIGVEVEPDYFDIAKSRIRHWRKGASPKPKRVSQDDGPQARLPGFDDD